MNVDGIRRSIRTDYDAWASSYDSEVNLTRDADVAAIRSVLSKKRVKHTIEFGCGTGKNTSFLAAISDRVLALDFSVGMLSRARRAVIESNVAFDIADIEQPWPVPDASQNLVVCSLVLQHVRDLALSFSEAGRVLATGSLLFVSELHPIKKFQGSMARYEIGGRSVEIAAFDHQISDYVKAAREADLHLGEIDEWWHDEDRGRPPRLVTFLFHKGAEEPARMASPIAGA
jgi:malonyl-CoA O-methyltransferase